MRKGGGKAKGAQFEREVCVALSQWVSKGESDDVFWRSAMSGGRATVGRAKNSSLRSNQNGDISCISPLGFHFSKNFSVECKFYSDLNYSGLLNGKGKLVEFWTKHKEESSKYKKHPMLVCRQNRMQTHVCFDSHGLRKLGIIGSRHILLIAQYLDLNIIRWGDFLAFYEPPN